MQDQYFNESCEGLSSLQFPDPCTSQFLWSILLLFQHPITKIFQHSEKSKNFYSEHPHTHCLCSTFKILLPLPCHIPIRLSTPAYSSSHLIFWCIQSTSQTKHTFTFALLAPTPSTIWSKAIFNFSILPAIWFSSWKTHILVTIIWEGLVMPSCLGLRPHSTSWVPAHLDSTCPGASSTMGYQSLPLGKPPNTELEGLSPRATLEETSGFGSGGQTAGGEWSARWNQGGDWKVGSHLFTLNFSLFLAPCLSLLQNMPRIYDLKLLWSSPGQTGSISWFDLWTWAYFIQVLSVTTVLSAVSLPKLC